MDAFILYSGIAFYSGSPDGVCGLHLGLADLKCILIGLLGIIYNSYNLTPLEE